MSLPPRICYMIMARDANIHHCASEKCGGRAVEQAMLKSQTTVEKEKGNCVFCRQLVCGRSRSISIFTHTAVRLLTHILLINP